MALASSPQNPNANWVSRALRSLAPTGISRSYSSFHTTDVGLLVAQVATGHGTDGSRVEVRAQPVIAEVDAPKVERIVENLLANALKHAPTGTPVCVRVEGTDDAVLIAVDDRGPGVNESQRETIFELFNRGEASSRVAGAGIGLSLVAQFAAVHGGRAWVEENPGGGASFRVLLPARRSDDAKPY